jgi:uncharacterized protein YigE (DUF2233 family)
VVLGLGVLLSPAAARANDPVGDPVQAGLELAVWDPAPRCEDVPPLLVVRIDPERFRFSIHHFADENLAAPLIIRDWQQRTGAVILFNAGLFRQDYSYLGLLRKSGRWLGPKAHPTWQGLFVAEPLGAANLRKARVMDLAAERLRPEELPYREAAQSIMLLDRAGQPRVRNSGRRAHQTVVGEDQDGRIVLIKTTQPAALWDLAVCLRQGPLGIALAMAMDGGASSDLLIQDTVLRGVQRGEVQAWRSEMDGSGHSHIPLPSVIGVYPRQ